MTRERYTREEVAQSVSRSYTGISIERAREMAAKMPEKDLPFREPRTAIGPFVSGPVTFPKATTNGDLPEFKTDFARLAIADAAAIIAHGIDRSIVGPFVALPFRMSVPWSKLCSDNDKEVGAIRRLANGRITPARRLTPEYKASKAWIATQARKLIGVAAPRTEPLGITVRVWLPPARHNDSLNFAKCVNDALERVVYANDNQLHANHWYRAGVDIDAPRADILIEEL